MVLSSQAQLFELRQVEACKRFQVGDVGKRMYVARGVEPEDLLGPSSLLKTKSDWQPKNNKKARMQEGMKSLIRPG